MPTEVQTSRGQRIGSAILPLYRVRTCLAAEEGQLSEKGSNVGNNGCGTNDQTFDINEFIPVLVTSNKNCVQTTWIQRSHVDSRKSKRPGFIHLSHDIANLLAVSAPCMPSNPAW